MNNKFHLKIRAKLPGEIQNTTELGRTHWMIVELSERLLAHSLPPSTKVFRSSARLRCRRYTYLSRFSLSLSLCYLYVSRSLIIVIINGMLPWVMCRYDRSIAVSFALLLFTFAPPQQQRRVYGELHTRENQLIGISFHDSLDRFHTHEYVTDTVTATDRRTHKDTWAAMKLSTSQNGKMIRIYWMKNK